jgi:hypothetical protein
MLLSDRGQCQRSTNASVVDAFAEEISLAGSGSSQSAQVKMDLVA